MKMLLLVQDKNNRSIQLLVQALEKKNADVLIWEIKDTELSSDKAVLSNGKETLAIKDISLVVKRTWGPIREKGLALCQALETQGVNVLNGCHFIKWSHSKIQQYQTLDFLKKADLFPETVCIDAEYMQNKTSAKNLLEELHPDYTFPMVLKKDKGCRADGVYFIDCLDTFEHLLANDAESLSKGFLLQRFISSHTYPHISNYFRLNVVDGKVQSAVQFQLKWQKPEKGKAQQLGEFKEAKEIPVDVSMFPERRLQDILAACPYRQDAVGIDVMFDGEQLYLLEYNDGPAISLVVDLGEKHLNSDKVDKKAAQACYDFAASIATLCVERAKDLVEKEDKKITLAFDNSNKTDMNDSELPVKKRVLKN